MVKARKIAAQFAAYSWYEENRAGQPHRDEATRFARENWTAFLPVAHEGLGKLLIRLTTPRSAKPGNRTRRLAVAG